MIATVIRPISSQQEAEELLAAWRILGNFLVGYNKDNRLVGLFAFKKDGAGRILTVPDNGVSHVPTFRHGDDRVAA